MHIAIVMDGNGRWAQAQGQPRLFGHREGARAVERTVEAARRAKIDVLTLFAFSSDNWQRPEEEVRGLMMLFAAYLRSEANRCAANGIRMTVIGRRDRLPPAVLEAVVAAERATSGSSGMFLRIAVDYSARDAIVSAARAWQRHASGAADRQAFSLLMQAAIHSARPAPDVDLLIRTGGELRLSDFMLWECAYAELVFSQKLWPDFGEDDLHEALREYASRERRFGRVLAPPPSPPAIPVGVVVN